MTTATKVGTTTASLPARPHTVFDRMRLQTTRSRRAWALGMGSVVFGLLALYTSVVSNSSLNEALKSYPPALRRLFSLNDFTTGAGYLRAELFSLTVPLLFVIPGILWGTAALADDEADGTIDLLATAPVSRRRIVLDAWRAVVSNIAELGIVLACSCVAGSAIFGLDVPTANLLAAALATTLLSITFATVAFTLAAATGRTGVSRGIAAVAAVAAYLASSLAELVGGLRPLRVLSPWYHALGVDPVGQGFEPGHLALLLLAIIGALLVADRCYGRRDLGV